MTTAYSSKNLKFPAEDLKNLLLYNSVDDLFIDCKYFGVRCNEKERTVQFLKGEFCDSKIDVSKYIYRLIKSYWTVKVFKKFGRIF